MGNEYCCITPAAHVVALRKNLLNWVVLSPSSEGPSDNSTRQGLQPSNFNEVLSNQVPRLMNGDRSMCRSRSSAERPRRRSPKFS
eukprot:2994889-Amphidinium_carterae.1